jgi:hypothetical protein
LAVVVHDRRRGASVSDNALVTPQVFSLPRAARSHANDAVSEQPQPIPVTITKIMGETVEVQVEAKGRTTPFTINKFIVAQAHSEWIRQPTQVGDKGWLVHANYNLGGMSGLGGNANYYGRANLTGMVFKHISQVKFPHNTNRNLNQAFINGPAGVKTQTTNGNSFIDIQADQIILQVGSTTMTITGSQITIKIGGNTHTFTSNMFKSAGNVETSANTTLDTHIHPGTAPPVPGT